VRSSVTVKTLLKIEERAGYPPGRTGALVRQSVKNIRHLVVLYGNLAQMARSRKFPARKVAVRAAALVFENEESRARRDLDAPVKKGSRHRQSSTKAKRRTVACAKCFRQRQRVMDAPRERCRTHRLARFPAGHHGVFVGHITPRLTCVPSPFLRI